MSHESHSSSSALVSSLSGGTSVLSMCLALAAAKAALALIAGADGLIEGFRPGVMDRLGVGWEALREVNPRLIYCAISGFGMISGMAIKQN